MMIKEATYKDKFSILKEWIPLLIEPVKKDLKSEHLKQDPLFFKKYFLGKNIHKLTTEELIEGYLQALSDGLEPVGEFIANRWLLKNSEVYNYFETELTRINPEFTELDELDRQTSLEIIEKAVRQFGAPRTYLFSVLNSVVFPPEVFQGLAEQAAHAHSNQIQEEKVSMEKQSLETMRKTFERELARVTDKYEKKLLGIEKKYHQDVEALKRQVASLQRKLNGNLS